MKMNYGVLALLLVGLVAVAGSVAALGGLFPGVENEEVRAAVEAGDFDAWKEAVESSLTEDNFNQIRDAILERQQNEMSQDAMRQAIEDGDYDAWKAAALERGMEADKIMNEDDFSLLIELHKAREEGDSDRVSELMSELKELGISRLGAGFEMNGPGGKGRFGRRMPDRGLEGGLTQEERDALMEERMSAATAACENLSEGSGCTISGEIGVMQGTCQSIKMGLVCDAGRGQIRMYGPRGQQSLDTATG